MTGATTTRKATHRMRARTCRPDRRPLSRGRRRADERGLVLLAVLLFTALIVMTAVTYAKHVTMAGTQTAADLAIHRAEESAESGVIWARQVLRSGSSSQVIDVPSEDTGVLVTVTGAGTTRDVVVDGTDFYGLGATVIGRAELVPDDDAELPTITDAAVARIQAASPTVLRDGMVVAGADLNGLYLLEAGATVTLRDVVLTGAIVSEPALDGPPYDAWDATTLIIEENVRIDPGPVLPDCSILVPDGSISASGSTSVELGGVVVARRMTLDGRGALNAPIAVEGQLLLSGAIDQPGDGRGPRDWPDSLAFTQHQLTTLAFPHFSASSTEIQAISSFAFPVKQTLDTND